MPSRKNAPSLKLIPVLALLVLTIPAAVCQLNSNTASVALNATLGESLTVAATPATVNIPLVSGGTAAGAAPVALRHLHGHLEYSSTSTVVFCLRIPASGDRGAAGSDEGTIRARPHRKPRFSSA